MARTRKPYNQRQRFWRRIEIATLVVMLAALAVLLYALFAVS